MISQVDENTRKTELNRRLESLTWGALFIATGTIWLIPNRHVPEGSWLIAVGLILTGLNLTRYLNGIEMQGLSLIAGILALAAGLGTLLGLDLPLIAIALIVVGLSMLLKPLLAGNATAGDHQDEGCCAERSSTKN